MLYIYGMGKGYHNHTHHNEAKENSQVAEVEAVKNQKPKTLYEILQKFASIPISKKDFMKDRPLLENEVDQVIDCLLLFGSIAGSIIAAVHKKDVRPLAAIVPALGIFSVDSISKEADFSEKQNGISFSPSTNVRFVINRLVELGVITAKAAAKLTVTAIETFKNVTKSNELEPELAR